MPFIKVNFTLFIYKEKSTAVANLKVIQKKLNQKIKKHNQLYFGTLVLALYCYCGIDA